MVIDSFRLYKFRHVVDCSVRIGKNFEIYRRFCLQCVKRWFVAFISSFHPSHRVHCASRLYQERPLNVSTIGRCDTRSRGLIPVGCREQCSIETGGLKLGPHFVHQSLGTICKHVRPVKRECGFDILWDPNFAFHFAVGIQIRGYVSDAYFQVLNASKFKNQRESAHANLKLF